MGLVGAQIAVPASAMGQGCTAQDKLRLYEQGYNRYQVEAMCNPEPQRPANCCQ